MLIRLGELDLFFSWGWVDASYYIEGQAARQWWGWEWDAALGKYPLEDKLSSALGVSVAGMDGHAPAAVQK